MDSGRLNRSIDLRNRVVIVTGASTGIGAATAVLCGSEGMTVVLAARRESLLQAVAGQVEKAGGKALIVKTDVRHPDQIDGLVDTVVEQCSLPGIVDTLIARRARGNMP